MIIYNATILTFNEKNEVIKNGSVEIENGKIKSIKKQAKIGKAKNEGANRQRKRIDAEGRVLMPGLINLHMHLYSTFARGIALKRSPKNFVQLLRFLWWRLDSVLGEKDVYYSALVPLVQAIRSGVTTLVDHHSSPSFISGSLDVLAEAFQQAGLRGCLCFEVSDRFGKERTEQAIRENLRFIERVNRWRQQRNPQAQMITAKFGLHASFTLSAKTLKKCRDAAEALSPEIGFHIHCAEDIADVNDALKKYKKRVVERLYESGILAPGTIAAHCVHINDKEIDLLKKTKTIVVHNPRSNMNNAVGVAPVIKMAKKGVRLGLGTDGMSVRVQDDFLVAPLLQKISLAQPDAGLTESYKALISTNAEVASEMFGVKLGAIQPGAAADLLLIDYFPPTPITPDNLAGHLFFGLFDAPVDTTIVNGKILMHNKKLLTLDEQFISAKAQEYARRLWQRF
ncbi:putative aminohydrolase SsnA [Candidatus Sumerlaeota bacterium]|nr:putative aminohydrolase SsnA [Candidatus Sumerlaeota bacterium]